MPGTEEQLQKEMSYLRMLPELLYPINRVLFRYCKEDISTYQPDVIIFIDFSGFNLRIAKWAKANGFKTNYYISPQVWASRAGRIKKIKRDIDKMYVILPFEKDFFAKHGMEVAFVGHPLLDAIENTSVTSRAQFFSDNNLDSEKALIALLPGSRKQEVHKMLSIMLSVVADFIDYQFVIAAAPSLDDSFYFQYINDNSQVKLVSNQTYSLLSHATAALVTSGTATLETALFKVPQVVCYKGSWISYQIAKRIITLKYISLVNLIMDKEVVKELIQDELTPKNLRIALQKTLYGPDRDHILSAYHELIEKLGGPGASEKAAALIIQNA